MSHQPDRRLHLRVVSHSEVGLVRQNNQDSGYASPHLLVVADGMGGAAAGDLASAVAIDSIRRLDTPDLIPGPDTVADHPGDQSDPAGPADQAGEEAGDGGRDGTEHTLIVRDGADDQPPDPGAAGLNPLLGRFAGAIADANTRIADLVADDYNLEGMGTTVTGAAFDGQRLALAHIGDSRAYLLRDRLLERLTHDHSWVQSLVDEGRITPEDAAHHPHRSLLLKVLNGQPANEPDLTSVDLRAGDRLLFCSDGLCGLVDDPEIATLLAAPDLEQAAVALVDAALAAGGIDNITVILAEAVEGPDPIPATGRDADGRGTGDARNGAGHSVAGQDAGDADDTAIRPAGRAAATVLGAAAERAIPTASPRVPSAGTRPDDDYDEDDYDEDTEAKPPAGTSGTAADDESRYTPGPPAKRRLLRTLLIVLAVLMVTAAGLGAGYAWTRSQYFVGAADGQVAIYQGLSDGIPGLPLSQVYEVQDLPVASLPPYYQAQVANGIDVASLDAARDTVEQLRVAVRKCAEPSPSPTAKSSPARPEPTGPKPTKPRPTTPEPTGRDTLLPGPTAPGSTAPTPAPTPTPTLEC